MAQVTLTVPENAQPVTRIRVAHVSVDVAGRSFVASLERVDASGNVVGSRDIPGTIGSVACETFARAVLSALQAQGRLAAGVVG